MRWVIFAVKIHRKTCAARWITSAKRSFDPRLRGHGQRLVVRPTRSLTAPTPDHAQREFADPGSLRTQGLDRLTCRLKRSLSPTCACPRARHFLPLWSGAISRTGCRSPGSGALRRRHSSALFWCPLPAGPGVMTGAVRSAVENLGTTALTMICATLTVAQAW